MCFVWTPTARRMETTGPSPMRLATWECRTEAEYQPSKQDGDIVWRFDMIHQVGVVPHDVCGSSPIIHGDFLYAGTTNGVDHTHAKVANPVGPQYPRFA